MSSSAETARKALLEGPVIGTEPAFLASLPIDNLVGAIVELVGEVYILRERLLALESELEGRRVLPAGAVEQHRDPPEVEQTRQRGLAAMTARVLGELARDRTPTSSIDPAVYKYLRAYAELEPSADGR